MEFYSSMRGMSPEDIAKAVEKEFEGLHYITEKLIRKLAKITDPEEDIANLSHLDISVDGKEHSIPRIGKLLPNLKSLKLNNSYMSGFRDLGTSLTYLRVLWAPRAGISDLDGISALPSLRELYISFNNVSDLTPLAMHERIQVLDLEGNCVEELDQLAQLGTCMELTSLSLSENPIAKIKEYRRVVLKMVSHIEVLDDQPYSNNERQEIMDSDSYDSICEEYNSMNSDKTKDMEIVTEKLRRKGSRDLSMACNNGKKWAQKSSAMKLDQSAKSRGRSNSTGSSFRRFKDSNSGKALTAQPPSPTNNDGRNGDRHMNSSSSDLTHGAEVVFAGNAVRALRRRRNEQDSMSFKGPIKASLMNIDNVKETSRQRPNRCASKSKSSDNKYESKVKDTRLSIMATLDRVMQMEERMNDASISENTKQEVLSELAKWKMDAELIHQRKVKYTKHDKINQSSSNERPHTARGVSREYKREGIDSHSMRPRTSPGLNRSTSVSNIGNNGRKRGNSSGKSSKNIGSSSARSLSDSEYNSPDELENSGNGTYDNNSGRNRSIVPGSPEWRRMRERKSRHDAYLKDSLGKKVKKAFRRKRKKERQRNAASCQDSEERNQVSRQFSKHSPNKNDVTVTPERQRIGTISKGPSSSGKKKRQPGEVLGILVDVKDDRREGKMPKTMKHKKGDLEDGAGSIATQRANIIKNSTAAEDTPDTTWRHERAKRKQQKKMELQIMQIESNKKSADEVLDTSTGSEMDIDLQIEEMNSRIQDMEAWGHSLGWKSPPSPTQMITKHSEYHVDDAVDADNGGKNKVHSPSTGSTVDPNSPKCTDDNDSVHSQDEHGLPVKELENFESKQWASRMTIGPGIERNDDDLVELLKVKPKRVPELRTHDGFQKFFSGMSEKRMRRLLEMAFENLPKNVSRKKIKRRMALMKGFLRK